MNKIQYYYRAVLYKYYHFTSKYKSWKTSRHIVIFESDDWGSVRMPSLATRDNLIQQNVPVAKCVYDKLDSLESNDDIEFLGDVLSSVKDINNHNAVFTANFVLTNPDFEKIEANNFERYEYELFTETYKRYYGNSNVRQALNDCILAKCFRPQFHGREHLNANIWMELLRKGNTEVRIGFINRVFSMDLYESYMGLNHVMASYDVVSEQNRLSAISSVNEGLSLFKDIFGFASESMIAPCYTWDECIENIALKKGVSVLQGDICQRNSCLSSNAMKYHYIGEENKFKQIYLTRNCFFEPSTNKPLDIYHCLKDIDRCFRSRVPAIVCTHRVNYIGSLDIQNRDNNLAMLKHLLIEIKKKWPDVEFMSSDQLGTIIRQSYEK